MKLRLEPISAIVLSILLAWGWYKATYEPVCYIQESVNGEEVIKPVYCKDIYTD